LPLLGVPLLLGAVALWAFNRDQQPTVALRPTATADADAPALPTGTPPTTSIREPAAIVPTRVASSSTPTTGVSTPTSQLSAPTASVSDGPALAIAPSPQPVPAVTSPPAPLAEATAPPALTPTSVPQPSPTATEVPALAAPEPAEAVDPVAAVVSFYSLAEQHEFDRAAQLWSARMRANYPPGENIVGRFGSTERLTLRSADILVLDEAAGHATVAIDLVEQVGGASRRFVGTWQLVRGPDGWLLDQPSLRAA
jgi:hypothetical protein